jgi:hypothetical protein
MDILLRGVSKQTYRKFKAEAAARGKRIAEALQEAIEVWLYTREKQALSEWEANNRAYLQAKRKLFSEHKGAYAAFGSGRLLGVAGDFDEVCNIVRHAKVRRSIITKVAEEESPSGGEWLWSSLEHAAA